MAAPNFSEILTTTLYSRTGQLADNMSKNNMLLRRLKERGRIKPVSGGESILQELEYGQNATYTRYAGYEVINIQPSEVFSAAQFQWKQAAVTVTISGLESIQNAGKEQIISLISARIRNAEKSANNGMWNDLYSAGTANGGKQVGGLQLLVADAPTSGTVGGINRATWTFWRNQKYQCSSDGGSGAASATNIQRYMKGLYYKLVRGTDKPDLILADTNYYSLYEASLLSIQRITQSDKGEAGFMSLKFQGADVVLDGFPAGAAGVAASSSAEGCPANHMYMLNTDYIHYRPSSERNWSPLDEVRSVNQDATVKTIAWAGNMTLSNAMLQGVMFQD